MCVRRRSVAAVRARMRRLIWKASPHVSRVRSAPADVLFMGSSELAKAATPGHFGSVASAVASKISCSCLIIKPDTN